ncbi:asparagine synthetase B [Bacillus sp. AFS006103]|nr:asparagine synthetase B [Bacillus sp. AFS006103]
MSAIYGIFIRNGEAVSQDAAMSLRASLGRYRADTSRTFTKGSVFLGCHFQMITPESIHEILPYYHSEADLSITADAIIDNREELFDRLLIHRSRRAEMTDSQLILMAFEKWGNQCPNFLVGDFAFVIWNGKSRELFCARDQRGTRTLYYHEDAKSFAFCTVMRPLTGLKNIGNSLNELWLAEFLAFPFIFSTASTQTTVYKNIMQLPPAHTLTITEKGLQLQKYWSPTNYKKLQLKSSKEYEEALISVLRQAVSSHLRSIRPVGIRLSGGLDSGTVAGLASRELKNTGKTLHGFSYVPIEGFQDWTPNHCMPDETPMISATINHVGNFLPNYCSFPIENAISVIDEWLDILEQPYKFVENSFWLKGTDEIAGQMGLGVVLNGGMGNMTISQDSDFRSYVIKLFKQLQWKKLVTQIAAWKRTTNRSLAKGVINMAYRRVIGNHQNKDWDSYIKELINGLTLINPEYAKRMNIWDYLNEQGYHPGSWDLGNSDFFDPIFFSHQSTIFTKSSLHHSFWPRDPTSDLRVIDFCYSVPEEQYALDGLNRSLIRRATAGILPDKVRLNQQENGYQGADWVHRIIPVWDQIEDELIQYTQSEIVREYLDVGKIKNSLYEFKNKIQADMAESPSLKGLVRSLIFARFIQKTNEGG